MTPADREDMAIVGMGINALLECVRQTEAWWRVHGDGAALRRTEQLSDAILATRRKFFPEVSQSDTLIAEALVVAEGLREAAAQCNEGQPALRARLTGGAEMIERLCRARGLQS